MNADKLQSSILEVPVRVVGINIHQAGPTYAADSVVHRLPGFFRGWLDKCIHGPIVEVCSEPIKEATTFGELLGSITRAQERLSALNSFATTDFQIEHVQAQPQSNEPIACTVNISLVEDRKLTMSIGGEAEVDGNVEAKTAIGIRNVFGGAERLRIKAMGTNFTGGFRDLLEGLEIEFTKPLVTKKDTAWLSASFGQEKFDWTNISTFVERKKFVSVDYSKPSQNSLFRYELAWRTVTGTAKSSEEIIKESGNSLKSSVKYLWRKDTRDDMLIPTEGSLTSASAEIAGLGGDVKFVKGEAMGQTVLPLSFASSTLSLSVAGGAHVPILGSNSRICDRFFLGHYPTFKGIRTVGPRFKNEAHAGDLYWMFTGAVTTPVTVFPDTVPIKTYAQFFGYVGNCVKQKDWKTLFTVGNSQMRDVGVRSTIGAGIVFAWAQFLPLRIELNCSVPVLRAAIDPVEKKYFHVSIGTSFP